ncbi:MAG: recombination protein RecR [Candidatus Liptonbacteria bacterium]|nr:recombination protein RecR [Candidatus Liptonbacteria bacterium]
MTLPSPIKRLVERLSELPAIGPRQATRLAFYLISRGQNEIHSLAQEIEALSKIKICGNCFFIHQNVGNLCDTCADSTRKKDVIAIIEKETDLVSIENTKKFNGRYLVLGVISKTGILEDWQKLRLQNLKSFINKDLDGKAEEIILAFSPTSNGDFNVSLLLKELAPLAKKVTRLGRGLPTGGEIEFADDETLGEALAKRS